MALGSTQPLTEMSKVKVKVEQFNYRPGQAPEGSRRLKLPDFMTIGT